MATIHDKGHLRVAFVFGGLLNNAAPMSVHPTLRAMTDLLLDELPTLAREVLESTQHALQSQPKLFAMQEAWARRRGRFLSEFQDELRPQLERLREGDLNPRKMASSRPGQLSLVDEHQALRDVGVGHVAQLCQEASQQELFQLGNFFTGLHRGPVAGRDLNALRPALFARALVDVLAGPDLNADQHFELVRAAAPSLAAALVPRYQKLVALMEDAQLTPMVSTRPGQERRRSLFARDSQPGALADWHARSQVIHSRPQMLPKGGDPMLDRLYERILADPSLAAPVKAQLARLQVAVARLSRDDASLLRNEAHPTWRLINAVAAYCSGFHDAQDPRLVEFLRFLEDQTGALVHAAHPSSQQFDYLLRLVDAFIARQARERTEPSKEALAALEREPHRGTWLKVLREQLDEQARRLKLSNSARRFLHGRWAPLVAGSMVKLGSDHAVVQRLLHWVEPLLDSLRERSDGVEKEQLRRSLPPLVAGIESLLAPLALADEQRKGLLNDLMALHSRVLSARGDGQARPRSDAPDEAEVSRFVEERDSEHASVFAHAQVSMSELPTQPLPLPHAGESQQRTESQLWLDGLRIGGWFHLFCDDNWSTTQLVWIGEDRQLFLFVDQGGEHRRSLTAGALAKLYLNGLAMYLEQDGLLERAVATLLQDLDR